MNQLNPKVASTLAEKTRNEIQRKHEMNSLVSKLENKIGKVTIKFTITVNQKHFKGSLNNQRITTKILSSM